MDHGFGSGSESCPLHRQNNKRTFSEMAQSHRSNSPSSSHFIPHDDRYNNEHAVQPPPLNYRSLALPPGFNSHYPGDGMDFRSPMGHGSASAAIDDGITVVDLTDDDDVQITATSTFNPPSGASAVGSSHVQRPPRYPRDIIGISSDDEEDGTTQSPRPLSSQALSGRQQQWNHNNALGPDTRDEVEFIEARRRSRPRSSAPSTPALNNDFPQTLRRNDVNPVDLTAEPDDDVVYQNTRITLDEIIQPPNIVNMHHLEGNGNYWRTIIGDVQSRGFPTTRHYPRENSNIYTPYMRPSPPGGLQMFVRPHRMDYNAPAFDMNTGRRARPPSPQYVPPPPAEPGFTRSPQEDDILVCPNCGNELAKGETDRMQEVWVIKACGHAYCGECAHNRTKASRQVSKKGKARATDPIVPPTFKKCVVPGCEKSAASKSMIHVFLGS